MLIPSLKGVSSNIIAVGVTTFLVAISTTAFYSISPFYLRDFLGISLVSVGLIENATEAVSQLCRLFSGIISDLLKRSKPMFFLGTVLSAVSRPFFMFANNAAMVAVSKIFDRLGNGISATPRDSYAAQNSLPGQRGANLGLIMTFKTLGCVVGSGFVAFAVKFFTNTSLRTLITYISIPSFIAVLVCWLCMKESTNSKTAGTKEEPCADNSFEWKAIIFLPKIYWGLLAIMGIFMLSRTPESYMLLSLKNTGLPLWFCSGTIGFFNAVSVIVSYPAGRLSDRFGRSKVLLFSFATLSAALWCFSFNSCFWGVIGVLFWGIQRTTSQILSVACISDVVPRKILGTAIGLLNLLMCFANVASGYVCGKVATRFDFYVAYKMSTVVSIIAIIAMLFFEKYYKKGANKRI